MNDDFLEAAILNWDDVPEPISPTRDVRSAPPGQPFNPFIVLLVLYMLAALVVGYRWYALRTHRR